MKATAVYVLAAAGVIYAEREALNGGLELNVVMGLLGKLGAVFLVLSILHYLSFVLWYKIRQASGKAPLPPGPTPVPLIGNAHMIANGPKGPDGQPLEHKVWQHEGHKHNGIFGVWLGAQYTCVITKPSVAYQVFVKNGRLTAERGYKGQLLPSIARFTRNGSGIAASSGRYWRRVRTRLEANISRKQVAEQRAPIVSSEVESVIAAIASEADTNGCVIVGDLTAHLKREAMNVGLQALFSRRFGSERDPAFKAIKHAVEYFFNCLVMASAPFGMFPWLSGFAGLILRDFTKEVHKRDEVFEGIIAEARKGFDELLKDGTITHDRDAEQEGEAVGCRNVADLIFWDQAQGRMNQDEVFMVLWDILFAMTDTTASTMEWMVAFLVNNPDVQHKIHQEIDTVIGEARFPALDDREKLPYLWAVVKEVMRSRLVSPMMFTHFADQAFTVEDQAGGTLTVPAGTMLHMHGYSMAQVTPLTSLIIASTQYCPL